jgi:hypothetical protein
MSQEALESRVARLEEQMSSLIGARTGERPAPDEWRQTVGMFRGDAIVGEMIEEARRAREEERRRAREEAGPNRA